MSRALSKARVAIADVAEEQLGGRKQVKVLLHRAYGDGRDVGGTLGHHHHVGLDEPMSRLTQGAQRQQLVVERRMIVVHQHDIHLRLNPAVLEGIVEDNERDVGVDAQQFLDALAPTLAHGQRDDAIEFLINLIGLITQVARGGSTLIFEIELLGIA